MKWTKLKPKSPDYWFVPRDETLMKEYKEFWSVKDIFPINSTGIVTARDEFAVNFEEKALMEKFKVFRDRSLSDREIAEKFGLRNTSTFDLEKSRVELTGDGSWESYVKPILYRPFDQRYIYYNKFILERPLWEVMRHMLAGENKGLISVRRIRSQEGWKHTFVSDLIIAGSTAISSLDINYLFPLYLYFKVNNNDNNNKDKPLEKPMPNLNPDFLSLISERTGKERSAEAIFYYIYGVLYTPAYRERYREFLRYDFPRIPVFGGPIFEKISQLGAGLVELHLCKRKLKPRVKYPVAGDHIVRRVRYSESDKRVWINDNQYFEGVEPEAWNYHIGGYQVLDKWLKERKKWGKPLTIEMIDHFRQVHEILLATIDLQRRLDEAWPMK